MRMTKRCVAWIISEWERILQIYTIKGQMHHKFIYRRHLGSSSFLIVNSQHETMDSLIQFMRKKIHSTRIWIRFPMINAGPMRTVCCGLPRDTPPPLTGTDSSSYVVDLSRELFSHFRCPMWLSLVVLGVLLHFVGQVWRFSVKRILTTAKFTQSPYYPSIQMAQWRPIIIMHVTSYPLNNTTLSNKLQIGPPGVGGLAMDTF